MSPLCFRTLYKQQQKKERKWNEGRRDKGGCEEEEEDGKEGRKERQKN